MSLPLGAVVGMIGVDPQSPPDGWLLCDGSSFQAGKYPDLAEKIPSCVLPNLTGLTLMGASVGAAPYPASSLGKVNAAQNADGSYGSSEKKLTLNEVPAHQHFGFGEHGDFPLGQTGNNNYQGSAGGGDRDNNYYGTTFAGGKDGSEVATTRTDNSPFSLLQPSYAIYFFIQATVDNPFSATQPGTENV